MVFTATELSKLENFPKGLRVLLLDEDASSCAETKSKLESMDYLVSVFSDEDEALAAVLKEPESFHIAIVEVSTSHKNGTFKFLEAAKDLPTVMTSNLNCLSTMMKCIALGAVEFLHKPLSEDKLRNIWQHVVHKAFNVGGNIGSRSLKPIKESVVSMLHLSVETGETIGEVSETDTNISMPEEEKDPAPSTPQLNQGTRLVDDRENANCSTENPTSSAEKDIGDHDIGESKSVDTSNTVLEVDKEIPGTGDPMVVIKEEKEEDDMKNHNTVSLKRQSNDELKDTSRSNRPNNKISVTKTVSGIKSTRKKVDWTPELHKRFVQAVEQLGVDQAIPSRILELMKVDGLTRHNVASHLQKYRMHRRSILPKEDERRWIRPRDQLMRTGCYPHRPVMAAYQSPNVVGNTTYPVWGVPGGVQPPGHMWSAPGYPSWQPTENWHWRPYPAMQGSAWGCPYPQAPAPPNCVHGPSPPNASKINWPEPMYKRFKTPDPDSLNPPLEEEVIDKVVKEAINKPWLPLPLGLKPPSTDAVLAELSRQGIPAVPCINGSAIC